MIILEFVLILFIIIIVVNIILNMQKLNKTKAIKVKSIPKQNEEWYNEELENHLKPLESTDRLDIIKEYTEQLNKEDGFVKRPKKDSNNNVVYGDVSKQDIVKNKTITGDLAGGNITKSNNSNDSSFVHIITCIGIGNNIIIKYANNYNDKKKYSVSGIDKVVEIHTNNPVKIYVSGIDNIVNVDSRIKILDQETTGVGSQIHVVKI